MNIYGLVTINKSNRIIQHTSGGLSEFCIPYSVFATKKDEGSGVRLLSASEERTSVAKL